MAWKLDFDEPVTLYRMKSDGISADILVVHSQKEYNEYMDKKEGWTHSVPALEYPRILYNKSGETVSVKNPEEEDTAAANGFGRAAVPPGGWPEPDDETEPELVSAAPRRGRPRKTE